MSDGLGRQLSDPVLATTSNDALVSADSHVVPLPTFWRDYLPAALRDRAPRV